MATPSQHTEQEPTCCKCNFKIEKDAPVVCNGCHDLVLTALDKAQKANKRLNEDMGNLRTENIALKEDNRLLKNKLDKKKNRPDPFSFRNFRGRRY